MTRLYSSISTETTLSASINTTQTTMQVPSNDAATALLGGVTLNPAVGGVYPDIFTVVIDPDTTEEEVVFIKYVSGNTFTISRGEAGTGTAGVSGIAHSAGATIRHVLTSSDLIYFRNGVVTADAAVPNSTLAAKGSILTATAASTPSGLAVGTNGKVLTADSTTATGLAWAAPATKIGQVVSTSFTANTVTSSTSYVDITNFTLSITPTLSTSKVLVIANFNGYMDGIPSSIPVAYYQIVRGSTAIQTGASLGFYAGSIGSGVTLYPMQTLVYLDSPGTTSATTYKIQTKGNGGNNAGANGVATLTLMEVLV